MLTLKQFNPCPLKGIYWSLDIWDGMAFFCESFNSLNFIGLVSIYSDNFPPDPPLIQILLNFRQQIKALVSGCSKSGCYMYYHQIRNQKSGTLPPHLRPKSKLTPDSSRLLIPSNVGCLHQHITVSDFRIGERQKSWVKVSQRMRL